MYNQKNDNMKVCIRTMQQTKSQDINMHDNITRVAEEKKNLLIVETNWQKQQINIPKSR